jgi:hypothetical protein
MAQKYAYVTVGGSDGIELKNKVVELAIWDEEFRLGTLMIGKVGIKWLPKRKQRGKGSAKTITWKELDAL